MEVTTLNVSACIFVIFKISKIILEFEITESTLNYKVYDLVIVVVGGYSFDATMLVIVCLFHFNVFLFH
jgi:hypothetical protein